MRKVIVVSVVIGALGAVSVNFKEYVKRIGVNVRLEVVQKTALLGTAKILRKGPVPVRRRERDLDSQNSVFNVLRKKMSLGAPDV